MSVTYYSEMEGWFNALLGLYLYRSFDITSGMFINEKYVSPLYSTETSYYNEICWIL